MAKIITYSLRAGDHTSDCYYQAISDLAERWTPTAVHAVRDIVQNFRSFRIDLGHSDRSDAAYTFELLVLGVMLREHGAEATGWPGWALWTTDRLTRLPKPLARLEPAAKNLRGWIGWLARRSGSAGSQQHERRDIARLIAWMCANGQAARADRLAEWLAFLEPVESASAQLVLTRALELADEFAQVSQRALGQYTTGVEQFRAAVALRYQHRYDAELVNRTPLEYHLGMFGTELLNRDNRRRFEATRRRVVILPPCMRAQPDDTCKAISTPLGALCQACTSDCHVHQVTMLGKKRGFEVYMIPDELRRIRSEAGQTPDGLGLVGVSCALTNWSGGWDTEALGVPAQGVLLDHVGCRYHWDDQGIETAVNMQQIVAVAAARLAEDDTPGTGADPFAESELGLEEMFAM